MLYWDLLFEWAFNSFNIKAIRIVTKHGTVFLIFTLSINLSYVADFYETYFVNVQYYLNLNGVKVWWPKA